MIIIETESGARYDIEDDLSRLRRWAPDETIPGALRQDGNWLDAYAVYNLVVDQSATFILHPLGEGDVTVRRTSRITKIYWGVSS